MSSKQRHLVLPTKTDLRPGCSSIVDQGELGSCTADAGAGIVDYCEKKQGHPFLTGKGYGYLPYEYVLKGLASDFWVLISEDWE